MNADDCRVAQASRVQTPVRLGLSASRRNDLLLWMQGTVRLLPCKKSAEWRGRHRQHARRVRYPITSYARCQ